MTNTTANNKRIAKNTLLLYFRMLFMMAVSLYTSRVVLNALGVEDFGIYNVVGGVVTMFSVLSGSLSAAISRFITYELGTGNREKLKKIFSSAVTIQIGLALLVIVLAEAVGIWFLNAKMNIPEGRMIAANWVFQFSLLTFAINLISVPYNACIIAHERMSAFAYISILEAAGKLAIAYLIVISPIDRLVSYSILMCVVAVIIRFVYAFYSGKHFEECEYHFLWDKKIMKQMFGFAGWTLIGTSAGVLRTQGVNVLLNVYFDPIVNAARGIAVQVCNAVQNFSNNFLMAMNPQIIKHYSNNDLSYSYRLVLYGARFSFFLLSLLSFPIICETTYILELWLNTVPDYAVSFVRLSLLLAIVETLSLPLITIQQATGKIKVYQMVVGTLHLLNFPVSYLFLYMGYRPEVVYFVAVLLAIVSLYARLYMLRKVAKISISLFNKDVVARVAFLALLMYIYYGHIAVYVSGHVGGIVLSFCFALTINLFFCIKRQEVHNIISYFHKK